MSASITKYTDLVTSEFQSSPNYLSMVGVTCQPFGDVGMVYGAMPGLFDLDIAVGQQLDYIGQWVGISRELTEPIPGVYFSLDTVGLGFDEGVWLGPYDPASGLVSLPDDYYRVVLAARIVNNAWKADIPSAYQLLNNVFSPLGYQLLIVDNGDLSMDLLLSGTTAGITPLATALLTGGFFDVRPIGVEISYGYGVAPLFGLDTENSLISGFDVGSWTTFN